MVIGVLKELEQETRVSLVPRQVALLCAAGHRVLIENAAGTASSFMDEEYRKAGAAVVQQAKQVWAEADLVVKVQEAQPSEFRFFRAGLILFGYMRLAAHPDLAEALVDAEMTAVAYETMRTGDGSLPLLIPTSEIAGRMAVYVAAQYLGSAYAGRGVLLGAVPGVAPANIVVLGGGVVGCRAARTALGLGAQVFVLDRDLNRLRELDNIFRGRVATLICNARKIEEALSQADVVIGAAMIPGKPSPKLVRREMISCLKKGSVLVDVAIDKGGCFETSHVTNHSDPVYPVDSILHYCVPNIAAAVPRTGSEALSNAAFPYLLEMAGKGIVSACEEHTIIREGLNTYAGSVTHRLVARSLGKVYKDFRPRPPALRA